MHKVKITLFGGTFDPIHLGHTMVAAEACRHLGAEKVIFVPAKCSPLKGVPPRVSDADRFAMIALAVAEDEQFEASDYELNRPAPSYTIETVRYFQQQYGPDTSIHWLIGADGINDLVYWYKITELIDICHLTTMCRGGCEPPDFNLFEGLSGRRRVENLQQDIVQTPLIDISSTEIRRRLAAGQYTAEMLHPAVATYIRKRGLYGVKEQKAGS